MLSDLTGMAPGQGWGKLRVERQWGGMNGVGPPQRAGGGKANKKKAKSKTQVRHRHLERAAYAPRRGGSREIPRGKSRRVVD